MQEDLAAKYQVVFHSYGRDLEAVQQLYEASKGAPPLPRNAPPVAGNVAWSRQLLRRIEGPMQMYAHAFQHGLMLQHARRVRWHNDRAANLHSGSQVILGQYDIEEERSAAVKLGRQPSMEH